MFNENKTLLLTEIKQHVRITSNIKTYKEYDYGRTEDRL